jgi:[ribosomal protein S18]-alanine N-acetyltransferase
MSRPADLVLRPLSPDDVPTLVALLAGSDPWLRLGYTREDFVSVLTPPLGEREATVAAIAAQPVGLAVVRPRFLAGDYLEILAVAEGTRGRRIGALLLEHVERRAFARAPNVFVCVSDVNIAARRFYARCGYAEVGPLPDLLVAGSAEILLRKTRGPARSGPRPD